MADRTGIEWTDATWRPQLPAVRLVAAVVAVLLFATGCRGETYVVRQINATSVICGGQDTPEKTFTKQWDPVVQIAPEIGQEWLCNTGGGR